METNSCANQADTSTYGAQTLIPARDIVKLRLAKSVFLNIQATLLEFRRAHQSLNAPWERMESYSKALQKYTPDKLPPEKRNAVYYLSDPRVYLGLCRHSEPEQPLMNPDELQKACKEVQAALIWASTCHRGNKPAS